MKLHNFYNLTDITTHLADLNTKWEQEQPKPHNVVTIDENTKETQIVKYINAY